MRACPGGIGFILENAGTCGTLSTVGLPQYDSPNGSGPGNRYYYWDMDGGDAAIVGTNGSVWYNPATDSIYSPTTNPILYDSASSKVYTTNSAGLIKITSSTGDRTGQYEVLQSNSEFPNPYLHLGKANSLGDLEFLGDPYVVEVGNRVWEDANNDGIQQAGELPKANVTVRLYNIGGPDLDVTTTADNATALSTAQTDPSGRYYFSSAIVNESGAALTSTASYRYGVASLLPRTSGYRIVLDNTADYTTGGPLANYILSPADTATGNGNNTNDSDATLPTPSSPPSGSNSPIITFSTDVSGANVHDFDFGFSSLYDLALSKTLSGGTPGPFVIGNTVTYDLRVYNQGGQTAATFSIRDTFPTGLTYVSGAGAGCAFTPGVGLVDIVFTGILLATTSTVCSLTFTISGTGTTNSPLRNWAEITADDGADQDSTPDTNTGSDTGPGTGTPPNDTFVNDVIDNTGGDEDDNDYEDIVVGNPPLSLGNLVWADANNDGIFQSGTETPIPSLAVQLFVDANTDSSPDSAIPYASTATNPQGRYLFTNLIAGDYVVVVTHSGGYVSSTGSGLNITTGTYEPGQPFTNTTDSIDRGRNTTRTTITSPSISLQPLLAPTSETDLILPAVDTASNNNTNYLVDFGLVAVYAIGNQTWEDSDNDGLKESGEPAIAGLTVNVYRTSTNALIATTVSDTNGTYLFDLLPADTYYVTTSIPSGFAPSTSYQSNPNIPNDLFNKGLLVGSLSRSGNVILGPGQPTGEFHPTALATIDANTNLTVDFGFYRISVPLATTGTPTWLYTVMAGGIATLALLITLSRRYAKDRYVRKLLQTHN